ncbi:MAG: inorganic diphosphatase, partial [Methanoregulaceae archaeon]|nr:inorganic diphosphatase [Methanoregulaceae archaeon]
RRAVEYLSGIAGVDPVAFGSTLIQEGMEYGKIPLEELLTRDAKEYSLFGKEVIIAQVMVASQEYPGVHAGEIRTCLDRLRKSRNVDLYMALFTDVIGNESELYASAEQGVLSALGYADQPVRFPGVMSRKKDFLPGFGQKLRNLGI